MNNKVVIILLEKILKSIIKTKPVRIAEQIQIYSAIIKMDFIMIPEY